MAFQIGICDDEMIHIKEAEKHICSYFESCHHSFQTHHFLTDGKDLTALMFALAEMDIIFMDICLGEDNGIEIASKINAAAPACQIIFFTNHLQYSTDVYSTDHCYFVLKAQMKTRIPDALDKAIERIDYARREKIIFQHGLKRHILLQNEIRYIERQGRHSYVHLAGKDPVILPDKMDEITARLIAPCFIRCHVSYIVNFSYVAEFNRQSFLLHDGFSIPISRKYYEESKERFTRWAGANL